MKYFIVLLAVAIVAIFHTSEAKIDKEKKLAMMKKCQTETKASDEDVELWKKHEIPETPEGKCFLKCLMVTNGMMKEGKADLEGINAFFEKLLDDQKLRDIAIKVAAACAATEDVKELDECEKSVKYMKCVKNNPEFAPILDHLAV